VVSAGSQCAKRAPGVVARTINGETLLVPVRDGVADCDSVFILNATGARVWELLDGSQDADALATAIEQEFDVASMVAARADVDVFLAALEKRSLITWERG